MAKIKTPVAKSIYDGKAIYEMAEIIRKDWGTKVNYAAKPYLDAMRSLSSIKDSYGSEDAKSIILYFLGNASSYRGDTAKNVKDYLKSLCK
jgi:hypothetical protein